jgi:transcriptional regulator with XRE-family HTH domain
VALQIAALREKAGLTQRDLARKLKTSQQQISRLESPSYEGHSLSMLRRVAEALGATVHVAFETSGQTAPMILSESKIPYRTGKHKG